MDSLYAQMLSMYWVHGVAAHADRTGNTMHRTSLHMEPQRYCLAKAWMGTWRAVSCRPHAQLLVPSATASCRTQVRRAAREHACHAAAHYATPLSQHAAWQCHMGGRHISHQPTHGTACDVNFGVRAHVLPTQRQATPSRLTVQVHSTTNGSSAPASKLISCPEIAPEDEDAPAQQLQPPSRQPEPVSASSGTTAPTTSCSRSEATLPAPSSSSEASTCSAGGEILDGVSEESLASQQVGTQPSASDRLQASRYQVLKHKPPPIQPLPNLRWAAINIIITCCSITGMRHVYGYVSCQRCMAVGLH